MHVRRSYQNDIYAHKAQQHQNRCQSSPPIPVKQTKESYQEYKFQKRSKRQIFQRKNGQVQSKFTEKEQNISEIIEKLKLKITMQAMHVLYQDSIQIIRSFNFLAQNRQMIIDQEFQSLKKASQALISRLKQFPMAQVIFDNILAAINKIQVKFSLAQNNSYCASKHQDLVYRQFCQQNISKLRKQSRISQKYLKKTCNQKLDKEDLYQMMNQKRPQWSHLFTASESLIKQAKIKQAHFYHKQPLKPLKSNFSKQLFRYKQMNVSFLCCSTFFCKQSNIFDQRITQGKLAITQSIQKISEVQAKYSITSQICGLLNGGGGTLLFDCKRENFNVFAEGYSLTENKKKEITQIIENFLLDISPAPQIKKQVVVNFVPIAQQSSKCKIQQKCPNSNNLYELQFISGVYVTRIIVRPSSFVKEYLIKQKNQFLKVIRYKSLVKNQVRYVQAQKPSMQGKIQKYSSNQNNLQDTQYYLSYFDQFSNFDHQTCIEPLVGSPIQRSIIDQKITKNSQVKYQHLSAIVVKSQYLPKVEQILKQKYKIACKIEARFSKYKNIKGAALTATIHHNIPYDQLQSLVSLNQDFKFEGRYLVIVQITDLLKLLQRYNSNMLPRKSLDYLQSWVDKTFKQEKYKVEIITCVNKKFACTEYYLNGGSKMCNFFLYLLLNSFGQKVNFKNPADSSVIKHRSVL